MVFNVQVTRIEGNPTARKLPTQVANLYHAQIAHGSQNNLTSTPTLVNVPEDRNIRKFPVRFFDIQAKE